MTAAKILLIFFAFVLLCVAVLFYIEPSQEEKAAAEAAAKQRDIAELTERIKGMKFARHPDVPGLCIGSMGWSTTQALITVDCEKVKHLLVN